MKSSVFWLLPIAVTAFAPSSYTTQYSPSTTVSLRTPSHLQFFKTKTAESPADVEVITTNGRSSLVGESSEGEWITESNKVELIVLGLWAISISAFILINNFYGPWPLEMKKVYHLDIVT